MKGQVDITTGKKLQSEGKKKKVVKKVVEEKPKTRWQKIMDWLNAPIGGYQGVDMIGKWIFSFSVAIVIGLFLLMLVAKLW